MNHTDRLKRARIALILDEPFFGSLLMHLKPIEDKSVPTFCTNGKNLRWNPAFMDTLDDRQLKTVLAHEVLHCALLHPFRRGDRNLKKFNIACDYAINNFLDNYNKQAVNRGHATPFPVEGLGLVDHSYDGQSAEEIYGNMISPQSGGQPGQGNSQGNVRQGNKSQGQNGKSQSPSPHSPAEHSPADSPSPGEFVDGAQDQAGLDEQEANWKVAMQQAAEAAKSQGKLPADIARMVQELVDPAVPWREVLRNFIVAFAKDDYSWARPNRRFSGSGVILPSLHSPRLGEIAVAIDTSGSIDEKELTIFLSEIRSILFDCRPEKLILIQCDAEVQEYREMDSFDMFDDGGFQLKGGGGTDFRPVFEALEQGWDSQGNERQGNKAKATPHSPAEHSPAFSPPHNLSCLIYLTDLMGDFPEHEPSYPVLWATINDDTAPFGTTLNIK